MVTVEDSKPTLAEVRSHLDAIDEALVAVLAERSLLIGEGIRFKRTFAMGEADRSREDEMLSNIEMVATSKGLDPRIARQVLRAVIGSFTLLEVEELGAEES